MTNDEEFAMTWAMRTYGGSFVQALATAFERADEINFKRLTETFPEYVKTYTEIGLDEEKGYKAHAN